VTRSSWSRRPALDPADFDRLRAELRRRLAADPAGTYRDWHAVQHELEQAEDADSCRVLADDLWELLPALEDRLGEERGRFCNNLGAFFGTPGPAASLARAEGCFARALQAWNADPERRARALHNRGSARAALAGSAAELALAAADLEAALVFRDDGRGIARAVTLHHLGIARRKLAERLPDAGPEIEGSLAALREALALRIRHGLAAGAASSRFQLGATLAAAGRNAEARAELERAAVELAGAGRAAEAALAQEAARALEK
jgi:hypothetical protein